jgi:hypothetical protein
MSRKYFGTDGIRGRANGLITPELALKVGQAAGLVFQRGEHRHRVVIGKDTRLSGYMIEYAMVAGFTSVGMDVLLLGPMPTPAVAMLTKLDARRPRRDDFRFAQPVRGQRHQAVRPARASSSTDDVEKQIEALIDSDMTTKLAKSTELGRAKRIDGVHDRYIEFAKRTLPRNLSGSKACASSSTAPMAPPIGSRPRRCGSLAPTSSPSASSRTASTSTATAARRRRTRSAAKYASCAPTSVSRSTATPTAWSSSTNRAS